MANSDKKMPSPVHDLRSALALLKTLPGEYVETDTEVDPHAELSGVYRYVAPAAPASAQRARTSRSWSLTKLRGSTISAWPSV
ncbi:3-polyprenyl-4-hydroxybenzoate carboxy-lyase [Klebsiella pneumoniae subsp. rhinoscleromatis]|nr:3-polyprenyl-4-hydroxybenzoate carboxy-lyase [Klebsiella pneumoniae subsp. rhinoscleromatis]